MSLFVKSSRDFAGQGRSADECMPNLGKVAMQTKYMLVTYLLMQLLPSVLAGQEKDTGSNDGNLTPIAYLVGDTWTAAGEISGFGKYSAERSYHWVLGRKFIEQRHVMTFPDAEMETKGIIGWNPEKKAIAAWGFGSDGGIAASHVTAATQTEIQMEGTRVGPFNAGPIRSTFRKVNDDEFLEIAEIKKGDDWVAMFTFRFRRTKSQ